MHLDALVPSPAAIGKISRRKSRSGTCIHCILDRVYDPKKKHTVPKRVIISRVAEGNDAMMVPNEKFFEYFPQAPLPPLWKEAAAMSKILNAAGEAAADDGAEDDDSLDEEMTQKAFLHGRGTAAREAGKRQVATKAGAGLWGIAGTPRVRPFESKISMCP